MTRQGKATIRDVAERTGVSITTVSHVLNHVDGKRVSSATRERIQRVARELNYSPNGLARGLRLQRTNTIGFLSDQIATTPHAGRLIQGAQDAAGVFGALLISLDYSGHAELRGRQITALLDRRVDGIIHAAMYHQVISLPAESDHAPAVLLNARSSEASHPSVVPDEAAGALTAVRELTEQGHRRIGFVNDAGNPPAAALRGEGYLAALSEAGIPAARHWEVSEVPDTVGGYRAARQLLDRPAAVRPTGLFCFNDRMAMGVYQAAAELGLRIPQDLSVVGFDNQELIAASLRPGLTTIALPHYEMGQWAVNALMTMLAAGDESPAVQEILPCPLVRRGSTAPPP